MSGVDDGDASTRAKDKARKAQVSGVDDGDASTRAKDDDGDASRRAKDSLARKARTGSARKFVKRFLSDGSALNNKP